jgi:hypothetical protein
LLAYEPAPNGHRGAFLMRSTHRFAADSDSCRGAITELTPRRLGRSLVLVTECRESSAWIWQSAADMCLFEVLIRFRNFLPFNEPSPIGQVNRTLQARRTASEYFSPSLQVPPFDGLRSDPW